MQSFWELRTFFRPLDIPRWKPSVFCPTLEFNGIGEVIREKVQNGYSSRSICQDYLPPGPRSVGRGYCQRSGGCLASAFPPAVRVEVEVKGGGDPYVILPPRKPGADKSSKQLLQQAFSLAEQCIKNSFGCGPLYLREGGSIPIIRDYKEVAGLDSLYARPLYQ